MFYAIDRGRRARRKNNALRAKKLKPKHIETRDSWSRAEVCAMVGISERRFIEYTYMGVIPKATYPSRYVYYWSHQALLLVKLFDAMREEGWPRRIPHFVGSPYWTDYLTKLRFEWGKEPRLYAEWKARGGNDNEEREDPEGKRNHV
jgi:hypothetical protein